MIREEVYTLINSVKSVKASKLQEIQRLEAKITANSDELELCEKCIELFRVVLNERRFALKSKIENLLSYGLKLVFEENLQVKLEYKKWGNYDRAFLYILDDFVMCGLDSFRGGGLQEVASFLIKILILSLYKPRQRNLFLGDEVFGAVRGERLQTLSLLIKKLTEKLKVQVILVENPGPYEHADIVYDMVKEKGKSVIRRRNE